MIEFMDEAELLAEFHRCGIFLPGEAKVMVGPYFHGQGFFTDALQQRDAQMQQRTGTGGFELGSLGALGSFGGALGSFGGGLGRGLGR